MIEVTWVLLAVLIGSLVYCAKTLLKPRYAGLNIPPFPVPGEFLTGHLNLWRNKSKTDTIDACREKVGDIFSLDLPGKLMVIVSGYDNIKEALVKHPDKVAERPDNYSTTFLNEINRGVFNGRGENWKVQRTASIVILRAFGMGKNLMAMKIAEEVDIFKTKLASFKSKPVDFRNLINISISNVICSMIVGKRFEHDDPYFVKLINDINYSFSKAPNGSLIPIFPPFFLRYMPFDMFGIREWMKHALDVRKEFSVHYINEEKKVFDKDKTPENFITAYFQRMYQEATVGLNKYLDEENLIASIRGLFIAGTETTSSTICWCVLFCLHYPDTQEKVFEEISTHVGKDRVPTMNDRPNLKYLDAVIREAQRFGCLVPLMAREVTENFQLKGYTIPKGCLLVSHYASTLHDPKPWGDPENFRPERFLDADGNLTNPEEFMPFGLGRRICLGEALAKMELFLFLAAMFQRFRFEPEDPAGELPSLKPRFQPLNVPQAYKVKFVPRSQSHVQPV